MDSLSYWKGLFNIFRKDVTIKKSDNKMISIINIENNTSEDIKRTSKSPTKASLSNEDSKNITEFDGVFETPKFDLFDLVQSNLDKDSSDISKDTTEGLKEFDEILQEVNGDILKDEQVSLNEIDNVQNNINELENSKQDYLELEIPTFERQDLNQTINLCSEQPIHLNDRNDPNNFDENKASEGDHTIKINANLDETVISISSENSQESNEIFISAENTITLQRKVNNNSNEPLLATQVRETNNDSKEPKNTDFNTPTNWIDETKEINRAISTDVSDEDCGYHSSDFEFITEDEAKLDGIIVNFNPKKLKIQKTDKRRKVKTTKIAIDNFAGQIIEVKNRSVDSRPSLQRERPEGEDLSPRPSNSQKNKPVTDNFLSGSNEDPEVHPELNIINPVPAQRSGSNLRLFRRKCPNNFGLSSKIYQNPAAADNFKQNNDDGKTVQNRNSFGPTIQMNCTEACNVVQINYHKNNTRNNCLGFNNLQSKYPTSTEDRWRDFQHKNRLIRQQFESNRETHRIFEGDEYYSLFVPNFKSFPNQSSIRFLENKSTMSGSMLVKYQGIGFNMQMLREMDENEADEVRDEADKCARIIFEMYPGENRRKRRRF